MTSPESHRWIRLLSRLIYDDKTVTLYTPAQKYYSTVEVADTIVGLIKRLEERFGVELPLGDLC